jgi:thioredoxin reductase (NADPH)
MAMPSRSVMDTRGEQMFPTLDPGEIERMRRFGEVRHFGASDMLAHIGEVGPGICVVLAGDVEMSWQDEQ